MQGRLGEVGVVQIRVVSKKWTLVLCTQAIQFTVRELNRAQHSLQPKIHNGRRLGAWEEQKERCVSPRCQMATRIEVNGLPREQSLAVAAALRRQPDHFDPHCQAGGLF